jgi:hypothetical protein
MEKVPEQNKIPINSRQTNNRRCASLSSVDRDYRETHKEWGRFIYKKRGEKNKNRGERQKNSENQVTLDSIFGASKKHYLINFVLYML